MYKIVFMRHGESAWNRENRFTGWVDVDLSATGLAQAKKAGEEVFVLRQSDRAAPAAIVTWTKAAEEHGCRQEKLRDATQTWQRWSAQPLASTKWPE